MLTSDLVPVRRRGEELRVVFLDDAGRVRARALAADLIQLVVTHEGEERGLLEQALDARVVPAKEQRLKDGLTKLILDRCTFEAEPEVAPEALRDALFRRATEVRVADGRVERIAVLTEVGAQFGLDAEAVDRALYADLRAAHPLRAFDPIDAGNLVLHYERALPQAVLLRATRVVADVRCKSPAATRALFRKLKFLRLLFTMERTDDGYRLVVDGPMSLFDAQARYGLQLAMALGAFEACDHFVLVADVRWGKERQPLSFRLEGGAATTAKEPPLPDEVEALRAALAERKGPWSVRRSSAILNLPGVGVVVPDLELKHGDGKVYLEVLGFWSRDAVWRRIEMSQKGLREPVLFAVSARLRVSEEALGEDASSALYVYKGVMSARAVLERADALLTATSRASG